MKAIKITRPGGPEVLKLIEMPVPVPANDQVLIRVKAAGINRPDIFQRKGNYPPPAGAPAEIPGLEVSGIIEDAGNSKRWKKGDAVTALLSGGGYAEFAIAEAGHCLPLPPGWSFAEAASLPETVLTVWHNVFQRGALKKDEHFLVHGGSSGIGITAIQIAHLLGAVVFATAGTVEKCDACKSLGAQLCVNYKQEDFGELLKNYGMDLILDMIGGDYNARNLSLLRDDGRLVYINGMKGMKAEYNIGEIMRRRLTITGSTLRPRTNEFKSMLAAEVEKHVWPLLENYRFQPVIYSQFPLENASDSHQLMETGDHVGKIILTVE